MVPKWHRWCLFQNWQKIYGFWWKTFSSKINLSNYKHFSIAKDFLRFAYNLKSYMRGFLLHQLSYFSPNKECTFHISVFLKHALLLKRFNLISEMGSGFFLLLLCSILCNSHILNRFQMKLFSSEGILNDHRTDLRQQLKSFECLVVIEVLFNFTLRIW